MPKRKAEKKTVSEADQLKRQLKDLREGFHPEPHYILEVGTKVICGGLKDVVIHEIADEGKYYLLDFTRVDNNYGNPIATNHCKMWVHWTGARPIPKKRKTTVTNDDIFIANSNRQISSLISYKYNFGIDMNPEYQRELCWTLEQKQDLIRSIFANIDIGKFTFIKNPISHENHYQILDGKQRLTAILEYYENRFDVDGVFYNERSVLDRNHFENYTIAWGEISDVRDIKTIKRIFYIMNKSGTPMDEGHLNKIAKEAGM